MFSTAPIYNTDTRQSENRIINHSFIEEVKPHDNVTVDPDAVDTPCVEVRFYSGQTAIILLTMDDYKTRLVALTGLFNEDGTLT